MVWVVWTAEAIIVLCGATITIGLKVPVNPRLRSFHCKKLSGAKQRKNGTGRYKYLLVQLLFPFGVMF